MKPLGLRNVSRTQRGTFIVRVARGGTTYTPGCEFDDVEAASAAAELLRRQLGRPERRGGRRKRERQQSAVLLCYGWDGEPASATRWSSFTEAAAAGERLPCRESCIGAHSVVHHDGTRFRVSDVGVPHTVVLQRQRRHEQVRREERLARHRGSRNDRTCSAGHPWTPENTGMTRQGARRCRACARERAATARQAARAPHSAVAAPALPVAGGGGGQASTTAYSATEPPAPEPKPQPAANPVDMSAIRAQTQERRNRRRHRKGKR